MIAVAISIGVFVTTFATSWVQDQTASPSITCAIKTNYIVEDIKFNFSGNDQLLVKITNKGEQSLYGFGFLLFNVTDILTFDSDDLVIKNQVSSLSPLKREQSAIVNLNLTPCFNASVTFCNLSQSFAGMVKTADKVTVANDACKAVSASATTITIF